MFITDSNNIVSELWAYINGDSVLDAHRAFDRVWALFASKFA